MQSNKIIRCTAFLFYCYKKEELAGLKLKMKKKTEVRLKIHIHILVFINCSNTLRKPSLSRALDVTQFRKIIQI